MYVSNKYIRIIALYIITYLCIVIATCTSYAKIQNGVEINEQKIITSIETVPINKLSMQPVPEQLQSSGTENCVAGFDEDLLVSLNEPEIFMFAIHEEEKEDVLSYFSPEDIALLERVTMSEASTQSFEVQVAVAQTIINRVNMGIFGDSVTDIVYSPNQYCTADNGDPNNQVKAAVVEAIATMPYPLDMVYFREDHYHTWANDYKKIGVFYFSLQP